MNQIKWQGKSKAQMHSFVTSNEKEGYTVIFEKSVAECGLFDPNVQDKLKIAVRTKSERIIKC